MQELQENQTAQSPRHASRFTASHETLNPAAKDNSLPRVITKTKKTAQRSLEKPSLFSSYGFCFASRSDYGGKEERAPRFTITRRSDAAWSALQAVRGLFALLARSTTSRRSRHRAALGSSDFPPGHRDAPSTHYEITKFLYLERRLFPPPHTKLNSLQAVTLRLLQTDSYANHAFLNSIYPEIYTISRLVARLIPCLTCSGSAGRWARRSTKNSGTRYGEFPSSKTESWPSSVRVTEPAG